MKTWKERIMEVTGGRNTRGDYLWYSHGGILDALDKAEGTNIRHDFYRSISPYLQGLVKGGFLIRAVKPHSLSRMVQRRTIPEYLYKQTGKPFKRGNVNLQSSKNEHTQVRLRAIEAHDLWREYRQLPKWYRDMMMIS